VIGRFLHAFDHHRLCPGLWLLLLTLCGGAPALAQTTNTVITNTMTLGVTAAPSPVTLLQTLTYTLSVTNFYPNLLTGATVTNTLSTNVSLFSASNSLGSVTNLGSNVVFFLASLTNQQVVTLTVVVQPKTIGPLTNITSVGQTLIFFGTNPPPITNITAAYAGHMDLQTAVSGPTAGLLPYDQVQYQLAVTNAGPDPVSGAVLKIALPSSAILLGITPASTLATTQTTANGQVVSVPLSPLAAGVFQQLALNLQLTNSGAQSLTAVADNSDYIDDHPGDNTRTLGIVVGAPLATQLTATLLSPQQFNPQTGLMEQVVRVTNTGTNAAPDVRLVVSGLTNRLANAVGTNGISPFVTLGTALGPQESIDLVLELYVPQRQPVANPGLTALATTLNVLPLPTGTALGTYRLAQLASGHMLLEFPSVAGHTYAVIYSDNAHFTNVIAARPNIVAPANVTQWLDSGPPKTVAAPGNTPMRFYRVLELP
jgi:uncharacterized repeat protein (TIGR01451 family)